MKKGIAVFIKKNMTWIIVLIAVLVVYLILTLFGVVACPLKALFGISCPGCGMSRALLSALQFDFITAFYYHPLWAALPIVVFLLIFLYFKKKSKAFNVVLYTSIAILFLVYFLRMFFFKSEVIAWDIESGLVYKYGKRLIELVSGIIK